MAIEITMPKLSDTMTEGLFAGWKKNIGDRIERGEIIAEVETDKAVMELEAFASGILIKTIVNGGENVPVGTVLGMIGEAGEAADSVDREPVSATAEQGPAAASEAAPQPEPPPATPVPEPSPIEPPPEPPVEPPHEKASPLVRRLAREQGIDLEKVNGSGPDGRITQDDLTAFVKQHGKPETDKPSEPEAPATPAEGTAQTPMRKAIAKTVTQSWQTIPHFSVTVEISMETCREIVTELKEGAHPIGYNALIIKASAVALQKFPLLCSGDPASSADINISFAVSKPDGLLMPVIRQCQRLSVAEIESESVRLTDRSRAGQLSSEEMTGGSFSISNLGMYGVDEFTALIIPGQTAILAVGAVRERPVVQSGHLASAATLRVTLCCDHRSVDGAYAASFLAELRVLLEKPISLLM